MTGTFAADFSLSSHIGDYGSVRYTTTIICLPTGTAGGSTRR